MNQFDEKSVLSDLPAQLRKDIFDNLYTDSLNDVPIFKGCSSQFMTELSLRMSPISFPQFQNVYCQGELGVKMYFITKGSVALILREVSGQPNQEDFIRMADSCVELCRGSFFGEAAVLGHPSRLETIVTTRSSTMMTLRAVDMLDLCQLSFEFKAKLSIIAFERMRRNRVSREIVECCAREFGLDPDELIAGTERAGRRRGPAHRAVDKHALQRRDETGGVRGGLEDDGGGSRVQQHGGDDTQDFPEHRARAGERGAGGQQAVRDGPGVGERLALERRSSDGESFAASLRVGQGIGVRAVDTSVARVGGRRRAPRRAGG
jgi:CRP-like cAMP-binding protein